MRAVMSKVIQILFGLFGLAVFCLMISFSFSALGRVYPGNFLNQVMGLALFDIGAIVWLGSFVWYSRGWQRAVSLVLFVLDFLGSLGLVAVEVLLGGQKYVTVAPWVSESLIYVFIGAVVANLAGTYMHHIMDPAVLAEIENQSMADDIEEEARRQAIVANKADMPSLGAQLAVRLRNDVRQRLKLTTLAEQLFDAPVSGETEPVKAAAPVKRVPRFITGLFRRLRGSARPPSAAINSGAAAGGGADQSVETFQK